MDVRKIAREQWAKKLIDQERYYDVEQWLDEDNDNKPVRLYFKPANMRNRMSVIELANKTSKDGAPSVFELAVSTIIKRCLTEDGKRKFKDSDYEDMLINYDADILWQIYYEISTVKPLAEEVEDAKKS